MATVRARAAQQGDIALADADVQRNLAIANADEAKKNADEAEKSAAEALEAQKEAELKRIEKNPERVLFMLCKVSFMPIP